MRFTTALVAGLSATITSGFLILPEITKEALGITQFKDTKSYRDPVVALFAGRPEIIDLECPSCPFAIEVIEDHVEDGTIIKKLGWVGNIENSIHLELSTDDTSFRINGVPVWPMELFTTPSIMATQMRKDTGVQSVEFPIDVEIAILPLISPPPTHDDGLEVQPLRITVLNLNGLEATVDTIRVDLVKTKEDGRYTIARTWRTPSSETPSRTTCDSATVWSLCHVKEVFWAHMTFTFEMVKSQAKHLQGWVKRPKPGCGRGRGRNHDGKQGRSRFSMFTSPSMHHIHGTPGLDTDNLPTPHHDHRAGHFASHHHHRPTHHFGRMLHKAVRFVIIPALLGMVAGLTASAVGMLVGQILVYLWSRTYRRQSNAARRQAGTTTTSESTTTVYNDEKDGLLYVDEKDSPPQYRDIASSTVDIEAVPDTKGEDRD